METLKEKVKKNLKNLIPGKKLKTCKTSILLALSGGRDSITLLDIIFTLQVELNLSIEIAYINHNLRGNDSDLEDRFIVELCSKKNLYLNKKIIEKEIWEQKSKKSTEMLARELRYDFFNQIIKEKNIDYIATAHNLNDRIETLFLNLVKRPGIETLCSIPFKNGRIIRPILNISRNEIDTYIKVNNLPFVEDKTNSENIYRRNIVRNKIMPVLNEIQPDFFKTFPVFFENIKDETDFIVNYSKKVLKKIICYKDSYFYAIEKKRFKKLNPVIQKYIIKIILNKIGYPVKLNKFLLKAMTGIQKKIYYYKDNFIGIEKSKFIWFINLNSSIVVEGTIINKVISKTDAKKTICFKNIPGKIRELESDDILNIGNSQKLIREIVSNSGIPSQLFQTVQVIEADNKEIIGFFINNDIFRIGKKYWIEDFEIENCMIRIDLKKIINS